jgi:hypothetical protein
MDEIEEKLDLPVVRLDRFLCLRDRCRASLLGTSLYLDHGHLTPEGSRALGVAMQWGYAVADVAH